MTRHTCPITLSLPTRSAASLLCVRPSPQPRAFDQPFEFPNIAKLSSRRHTLPQEMATPTKDRSHWVVKKFTSHEDLRAFGIKEWQKLSGAARRKAAWELVEDYWVNKKGKHPDELRLQRVITSFQRPRS
jgi:hypothetical protein